MDDQVYGGLKALFEKYIDSRSAAMEVNISSATKYSLTNLFALKELELEKVFIAMETAVKEISYLMNDSTIRFRKQSIFEQIIQMTEEDGYCKCVF